MIALIAACLLGAARTAWVPDNTLLLVANWALFLVGMAHAIRTN